MQSELRKSAVIIIVGLGMLLGFVYVTQPSGLPATPGPNVVYLCREQCVPIVNGVTRCEFAQTITGDNITGTSYHCEKFYFLANGAEVNSNKSYSESILSITTTTRIGTKVSLIVVETTTTGGD